MLDLVSLIKTIAQGEIAAARQSALGRVEVVHAPDAGGQTPYACDVALQGSDAVYEKVPLSTAYLGQLTPPVVGDVVVIQFIAADPDMPIITGFVFSEAVMAPEVAPGERLITLPHDAAEADRIEMRQTAGANGSRTWRVTLPEGPEMTITDGAITAVVGDYALKLDTGGETTLSAPGATLTLAEGGEVTLTCDGALNIEAGADLALAANGNVTIDAAGTMALSASKIDLN